MKLLTAIIHNSDADVLKLYDSFPGEKIVYTTEKKYINGDLVFYSAHHEGATDIELFRDITSHFLMINELSNNHAYLLIIPSNCRIVSFDLLRYFRKTAAKLAEEGKFLAAVAPMYIKGKEKRWSNREEVMIDDEYRTVLTNYVNHAILLHANVILEIHEAIMMQDKNADPFQVISQCLHENNMYIATPTIPFIRLQEPIKEKI